MTASWKSRGHDKHMHRHDEQEAPANFSPDDRTNRGGLNCYFLCFSCPLLDLALGFDIFSWPLPGLLPPLPFDLRAACSSSASSAAAHASARSSRLSSLLRTVSTREPSPRRTV
eukprot:6178524-Pleurochrysis_carterae.AAC.1